VTATLDPPAGGSAGFVLDQAEGEAWLRRSPLIAW
jgi:hypothetical protein